MSNWFEELPEKCPPDYAFNPDGLVFYRLCETVPPTENDLKSQRAICPTCKFDNVSECITRSLSLWDNLDKCINLLKLPRHRGKAAMRLELKAGDGLVLQTFKPNHYSWWRTTAFDIASVSTTQ